MGSITAATALSVSLLAVLSGCGGAGQVPAASAPASAAPAGLVAIVAAFDRMAARPLWPGFEPARIPLAIFDGRDTFLVRHPSPPAGAARVSADPPIDRLAGRDPALNANTAAVLGGSPTATMLLDPAHRRAPEVDGATLIHEAFHVYQAAHHPTWTGNEVELFTYPFGTPAVLRERILEERALGRALAAPDPEARCWAALVRAARARRFALLSKGAADYERRTELKEGLARHVQDVAAGARVSLRRFEPEQIRDRAYVIGAGIAELLERLEPGWSGALERGQAADLDQLLARVRPDRAEVCAFSPAEQADADRRARTDADEIVRSRALARDAFDAASGWRVIVTAGREPLGPQGFDPLNVRQVAPGAVLHARFVKLGNAAGTVEVLGHPAMSEAAGAHPLFEGVRRLTIAGLAREPTAEVRGDRLHLEAAGISLDLRGARLDRDPAGRRLLVVLE